MHVCARIDPDFKRQTIDCDGKRKYVLNIWDTADIERFKALSKSYYRDADGAIIIYDITNRKIVREN